MHHRSRSPTTCSNAKSHSLIAWPFNSQNWPKTIWFVCFLVSALNIQSNLYKSSGKCKSDQEKPQPFSKTNTGQRLPTALAALQSTQLFKTSKSVILVNEDKCHIGNFVMVQSSPYPNSMPSIARVVEIVQLVRLAADHQGIPDAVLLQQVEVLGMSPHLMMLCVLMQDSWKLIQYQVCMEILFLKF